LSRKSDEGASSLARGFIIAIMNPFIAFIAASPSNIGASTAERVETRLALGHSYAARLASHRRRLSMVAAEYGSPPEIAGHAGAGVGLYILARPMAVH